MTSFHPVAHCPPCHDRKRRSAPARARSRTQGGRTNGGGPPMLAGVGFPVRLAGRALAPVRAAAWGGAARRAALPAPWPARAATSAPSQVGDSPRRLSAAATPPAPSHPQRALRAQVGAALALGRLNHLAVAVPDLDASVALYRDVLGAEVSEPESLPEHGVTVVFINLPNTKIELLHPFGERSPIQGFLDKNPAGGMHHVCIEVADVTAAIAELKAKGIRVLSEEPKIGAHNKPVVFLHPKDCGGVLVELEEE